MTGTSEVHASMKWKKELIFKLKFGDIPMPEIMVDETNKEEENMVGTNPSRLLGAAVMSCLSSSLLFCMSKKEMTLDDFEAKVRVKSGRNDDGRVRVLGINVELIPTTNDPDVQKRLQICKKMFQKYCTVTESVRAGIDVNVDVHEAYEKEE